MKKSLETLGGLLVIAGAAGIVHRVAGWAPFGVVVRVARGTPFVRDHEIVAYGVLIALGIAVLMIAGSTEARGEPEQGDKS